MLKAWLWVKHNARWLGWVLVLVVVAVGVAVFKLMSGRVMDPAGTTPPELRPGALLPTIQEKIERVQLEHAAERAKVEVRAEDKRAEIDAIVAQPDATKAREDLAQWLQGNL
jgi:hypothetical protein